MLKTERVAPVCVRALVTSLPTVKPVSPKVLVWRKGKIPLSPHSSATLGVGEREPFVEMFGVKIDHYWFGVVFVILVIPF